MSNLKSPKICSYAEANHFLGKKNERPLCYRTRIFRNKNSICIKYIDTIIISYYREGSIELNSGGWRTATTLDRLRRFTPIWLRITCKNKIWSVEVVDNNIVEIRAPFEDNTVVSMFSIVTNKE